MALMVESAVVVFMGPITSGHLEWASTMMRYNVLPDGWQNLREHVAMELLAKTMEEAVRLEEPCGFCCTVDIHG